MIRAVATELMAIVAIGLFLATLLLWAGFYITGLVTL